MRKWKTIQTEYFHKSSFGSIRKDSCELPNGILINDYYVNEYSDWVNAVVITEEQKIVLENNIGMQEMVFSLKSLLEKRKTMKRTRKV